MENKVSEPVEADLHITLFVECPKCNHLIDLMQGDINDDGYISKQAVPTGDWSEPHEAFSEQVECPECSHNISVKGIAW
jgi:DNA-directed RNA polymerase subunit RPC12/RpoP